MRLTEKENETLPIDVSEFDDHRVNLNFRSYFSSHSWLFAWIVLFTDCITDPVVVCDDLLWYCPHCWRVQRHGRLLRAEKQVGGLAVEHLAP